MSDSPMVFFPLRNTTQKRLTFLTYGFNWHMVMLGFVPHRQPTKAKNTPSSSSRSGDPALDVDCNI